MTNSAGTARADTAAGDTGIATQFGNKPRRTQKTIAITDEAYTEVTRLAEEEGTDRKTVASRAILAHSTEHGVNEDLPRLKAKSYRIAELYLDQLKKELKAETLKVSVREFAILMRAIRDEEAIPEKSSTSEHAPLKLLKEVSYDPEIVKRALKPHNSLPAGDRNET
jgi:hypothetical protein